MLRTLTLRPACPASPVVHLLRHGRTVHSHPFLMSDQLLSYAPLPVLSHRPSSPRNANPSPCAAHHRPHRLLRTPNPPPLTASNVLPPLPSASRPISSPQQARKHGGSDSILTATLLHPLHPRSAQLSSKFLRSILVAMFVTSPLGSTVAAHSPLTFRTASSYRSINSSPRGRSTRPIDHKAHGATAIPLSLATAMAVRGLRYRSTRTKICSNAGMRVGQ